MSKIEKSRKSASSDPERETHRSVIAWLAVLGPERPEPQPHELDAAARRLTRLIVRRESDRLREVEGELRALLVAWLLAAAEREDRMGLASFVRALSLVASAANEQHPAPDTVDAVAVGSIAERFIEALSNEGELNNSALAAQLGKDLTEISRTGGRLIELGLVTKTRAGKSKFWRVTPWGEAALRETARRHVERRKLNPEFVVPRGLLARYVRQHERSRPHFAGDAKLPAAPEMLRSALNDHDGREAVARELRTWAPFGEFSPAGPIKFATLRNTNSAIWELLAAAVDTTPGELRTGFTRFWPAAPPRLDAVGAVRGRAGELALVLLDAPQRPAAFGRTTTLASTAHVKRARIAVDKTFAALQVSTTDIPIADAKYPDWVKRLVLQHYLRETYPLAAVWAAHVCFIAEPDTTSGGLPSARRDWESPTTTPLVREFVRRWRTSPRSSLRRRSRSPMGKAVYISSALGFTEAGTQYYAGLVDRLRNEGFHVLDPWAFESGESTKEWQLYAELAGGTIPLEVCSAIGMRNVGLADQADAVLAVLDGADVDSGVACEVGYALAKGKPVIGLRTDRRRCGDSVGININLQVLYAVLHHELGDYVESVERAVHSLHVAVSSLSRAAA